MKLASANRWLLVSLQALGLLMPTWAAAMTFDQIVVFGTSLSDPGNAFALLAHASHGVALVKPQTTPPYDTLDDLLVPSAPYAKGGHHFTNGATWIEQFAQGRGLAGTVRPAFQDNSAKATNYAVGGARATDHSGTVNLPDQLGAFLSDHPQPPPDALYVVEMGSNDVRDALETALTGGNPLGVIGSALASINDGVQELHTAGAQKFLIVNVPNLALTPAVL
jgi:phospholipase/lecithinase/hemolysin